MNRNIRAVWQLILLPALTFAANSAGASEPQPLSAPAGGWLLQADHSDEFNTGELDLKKWDPSVNSWGGWSWESQNVQVADGCLNLTMHHKEHVSEKTNLFYTSGIIRSKGKPILYGYLEARIKAAPVYPGVCPAFWGFKRDKDMWTEIDFYELTESYKNEKVIDMNMHVFQHPDLEKGKQIHVRKEWQAPWDPRSDFHVYGCEWNEHEIKRYIDGKLIHTNTNEYWHQALDVVLSLGLRSPLAKKPSAEGFPAVCSVDYVRVWERAVVEKDDSYPRASKLSTGSAQPRTPEASLGFKLEGEPVVSRLVTPLSSSATDKQDYDASVTYPENANYKTNEGVRFYSEVVSQPWREKDDVIDGFDWSLPPGIRPSPVSWVKGAPAKGYPGNRIDSINTSWRDIEPEQGRFDYSGIVARLDKAKKEGMKVELHVRASVWDIETRDAAGKIIPPSGRLSGEITAPRWLNGLIPDAELTEARKAPGPNSRSLVNCDIFHPEYHRCYLRMVEALGKSGLPDRPEIALVYIHMVSGTGGEENDGASINDPKLGQVVRERIAAWVKAFAREGRGFAFTGYLPENLEYCYKLGVGQRNGLVECYLLHTHNPQLGQSMDADGHMIVDESLPPIAKNLMFGDENEEYTLAGSGHTDRFGPRSTWNHRYREASLRVLQMRRNYLWEPYGLTPDPYLSAYLALSLGRNIEDTPDAWCYLRESYVHAQNKGRNPAVPVKNFERWLVQRDLSGEPTEPAHKVFFKDHRPAGNIYNCYVPGMNYDYVARKGRRFGFALDDRFIVDASQPVAVKVTYYDDKPWKLVYRTKIGTGERAVQCRGDGALRTATFFLPDARFDAKGSEPDLEIHALGDPATIRFMRIIRCRSWKD